MIEDPESSFMYFKSVISELMSEGEKRKGNTNKNLLTTIRQLSLCLWILHAWSRDLDNIESAYLASEVCILSCWEMIRKLKKNAEKDKINNVFEKIKDQYLTLNEEYLIKKASPLCGIKNGITSGIYPPCKFAINFKVYDLIGRYAMYGLWLVWKSRIEHENSYHTDEENIKKIRHLQKSLENIIVNNPSAHLPFKDDNSIELALASFFLMLDDNYTELTKSWIAEIIERAEFTLKVGRNYSRTLFRYAEFLEVNNSTEYKNEVTKASVLYALLAYLSTLLNSPESYQCLQDIKNKYLSHSNLQLWFPSKNSEDFYYNGNNNHGVAFSNVPLDKSPESFLFAMNNEAKMTEGYYQLSAIKEGILPIIFLASRVNRYPIPLMAFGEEFSEEIAERTK